MNDEIKEILKILKECEFGACITKHNSRVLLDYITNLQEDIRTGQEINSELKQENERLKEENQNLLEEIHKATISSYEQGQQDWKELNKDYKSRCEKAIEYINENKHLSMFADCREPEEDWNYDLECSANDLLSILQNGSEEKSER